jgi:transcriptional pleiotropic regulator of transition state genes
MFLKMFCGRLGNRTGAMEKFNFKGVKGMQATGIVRKVDELGRIVVPKELRNILGINVKDAIEIYTEADKVILKKYQPNCVFCGGVVGTRLYMGKSVCENCRNRLARLSELPEESEMSDSEEVGA